MYDSTKFLSKVNKNGKISHYWREVSNGLFATICNPGLLRAKSELYPATGKERLCKVCSIHL